MTTLAARIAKASREIGGALATDKRNLQANYDYISADKILDRAGQVLAGNDVVVIPAITATNIDAYTSAKGATYYGVTVNFAFTVTDGETTLEFPWVGMGSDYSVPDKALYKAITSGHKYFLVKLLNIGAGNEDGEHEAPPSDTQSNGSKPNGTPAPAKRQAAPPPSEHDNPFTSDEDVNSGATEAARIAFVQTTEGVFGKKDSANARHWFIQQVTRKLTPENVRESSIDLTAEELKQFTSNLAKNRDAYIAKWTEHKAAQQQPVAA